MRSKIIKKLVPKKLQDRKRRKNKESEPLSSSEGGSCWGEDKSELLEEEEIVDQQGLKDAGKQLTELLVLEEGADEEKDNGKEKEAIHHASRGLRGKNEIIPGEERAKQRTDIQRKHNSSYLILFVIILTGLVRGRILALLLTVALCLMFKIITRCKRCKQAYE
uniref:Uncharacterized protein n=1 Tax=Rhizophora mucronata TaxID=61149 RepID=A0A2P2NQS5_RHIMU